ncbi:ABCB8 protein, partial [Larus smithsonianus]|nr:ABCB8 protein [Larus smithsonianus]
LALGAALLNVRIPVLLGQLVDVVARCARGPVTGYLREVRRPALRLLAVYCLQGLLTFGYIALLARVGERVAGSVRKALFISLLRQDVAFFDASRTGQLVNRLTADIQEFKSSFKLAVSQVRRTGPPHPDPSAHHDDPRAGAPLLWGQAGRAGGVQPGEEKAPRRPSSPFQSLKGLQESWGGTLEQGGEPWDEGEGLYCAEVDRAGALSERLGLGIAAFQGLSNLALNGIVLGTIFVGGSLMAGDELSPGDLMSFLVASQTVQRGCPHAPGSPPRQVVRGLSAGARVFELLRLEPGVGLRGGGSIPHHSLLGRVCFHRVSFSYPSRPGYPVLRDFSLTLPPCKTVAIVGPSGGGTAPPGDRGHPAGAGGGGGGGRSQLSWSQGAQVRALRQEPVLFGTTILENIRFGKPGASDAEVVAAARLANADGFIRTFPEGYHTVVGERGAALSGGQKQRIAIARALLKDPAVLVLDEATSALDAQAERAVQEALDRAAAGRTVLLIAHRLSTIRHADLIVVLARGRVAEAGTHEELVRRGGLYAELIRRQTED